MKLQPGILAALTLALLVPTAAAVAAEQTRETYKAGVEPLCKANRKANERIMSGARRHISRDEFVPVGKQFIRLSDSFGGLIRRIVQIPPPVGDERRVGRWFEQMRLLKTRLRAVGRYYKQGREIKAAHESILAERAGIGANNISIVFKVRYCRFGRIKGA